MNYWTLNMAGVWALCVLLAGVLLPQILLIAFRRELFDPVDPRKIHKGFVPRLGGMAFVPVIFLSSALMLGLDTITGHTELNDCFSKNVLLLIAIFCSAQMLYLVGIADDLIGVRYRAKFLVQMVCSILLILAGLWFNTWSGILGVWSLPPWLGMPFTFIIIVFVINAINLIDGIDGLASGLSSIATFIYGIAFFELADYAAAFLSFAVLGVLLPFFYYNVFGNAERHSKIFMGDTGSLTVGLLLAVLGIRLFTAQPGHDLQMSPTVLAFSPLVIPCFDVVRVYLWRLRHGCSPFKPDKNHIHHKMLAAGIPQNLAMLLLIVSSCCLVVANVALSAVANINFVVLMDIVLWMAGNLILDHAIRRRNARLRP